VRGFVLSQFSCPLKALAPQTNPQKCIAKHAKMIIAKYASQHNIEKAAAKSTPQNP
jgi:hypothetical protein